MIETEKRSVYVARDHLRRRCARLTLSAALRVEARGCVWRWAKRREASPEAFPRLWRPGDEDTPPWLMSRAYGRALRLRVYLHLRASGERPGRTFDRRLASMSATTAPRTSDERAWLGGSWYRPEPDPPVG